jgi:hypothetical protein
VCMLVYALLLEPDNLPLLLLPPMAHLEPLLNRHHPPSPNAQLYVEACSDRSATPVRGIRSAVVSRSLSRTHLAQHTNAKQAMSRPTHQCQTGNVSPNTPMPNRQCLALAHCCCPFDHQLLCQKPCTLTSPRSHVPTAHATPHCCVQNAGVLTFPADRPRCVRCHPRSFVDNK